MAVENDQPSDSHLESREPTLEDLRDLCRALNERGARYVVIAATAVADEKGDTQGEGRGRPRVSTLLVCRARRGAAWCLSEHLPGVEHRRDRDSEPSSPSCPRC